MKTMNQSLLRIARLLLSSVFVAFLGVGTGTFIRNQEPLLVKMDKAIVSVVDNNKVFLVDTEKAQAEVSASLVKIEKYTCKIPSGLTMNIFYQETKGRHDIVLCTRAETPTVINHCRNKPPRSDTIEVNTS